MTNDERMELWSNRISNYRSSQMTAEAWCNENNVSIHSLKSWITKFNKKQKTYDANETEWISVDISKVANTYNPLDTIYVKIGACSIEVANGFNKECFSDIVQVLTSLC